MLCYIPYISYILQSLFMGMLEANDVLLKSLEEKKTFFGKKSLYIYPNMYEEGLCRKPLLISLRHDRCGYILRACV